MFEPVRFVERVQIDFEEGGGHNSRTKGTDRERPVSWRILLEVVFALAMAFAARGFWACAKRPAHLRRLRADPSELRRIIDLVGLDELRAKAQILKLLPGPHYSGEMFILWDMAEFKSVSGMRNRALVILLAILAASLWLGIWCFALTLSIFMVMALSKLPAAAKNDNNIHHRSVFMQLMNWRQEDEQACAQFCEQQHPGYRNLYQVLVSLQPRTE